MFWPPQTIQGVMEALESYPATVELACQTPRSWERDGEKEEIRTEAVEEEQRDQRPEKLKSGDGLTINHEMSTAANLPSEIIEQYVHAGVGDMAHHISLTSTVSSRIDTDSITPVGYST